MINFKEITQAAYNIFNVNLGGNYIIERNPVRPSDPYEISRKEKKGWIGIYRDSVDYDLIAIGNTPWDCSVKIMIEIQVTSPKSREDCEDKLCDAEEDVLDVLEANRTLGGYLGTINGYSITYQNNEDEQTYYQAALISVTGKARQ